MECNVNFETEITVMSYPMVHLKVAYGLLARHGGGWIERPGDFLLGSVAPDAVHFHDINNQNLSFPALDKAKALGIFW